MKENTIRVNIVCDTYPFQLACAKATIAVEELGAALEGKLGWYRFKRALRRCNLARLPMMKRTIYDAV